MLTEGGEEREGASRHWNGRPGGTTHRRTQAPGSSSGAAGAAPPAAAAGAAAAGAGGAGEAAAGPAGAMRGAAAAGTAKRHAARAFGGLMGFGDRAAGAGDAGGGRWAARLRPTAAAPSVRATVALSAVLVLCSFALLSSMGRGRRAPGCNPHAIEPADDGETFTIVLNTFRRPERLRTAIAHYSTCGPTVRAIHVPWSEVDVAVPSRETRPDLFGGCKEVSFHAHNTTSINNRFRPIAEVPRDSAVFSVDDDVLVSCDSLAFAFEAWRSARENMVGFIPRGHEVRRSNGKDTYKYLFWWRVWWSGEYSIVLTKASFFNEKYLGMYTERMGELRIDEYIDEKKNCEDIAMQFLISNATGLGPIFTSGSYSDSGAVGGISTQHGLTKISTHYRARSDCIDEFTDRFGRFPLVMSHQFVSQMRRWTPFKAPSSWLEYFSNPF